MADLKPIRDVLAERAAADATRRARAQMIISDSPVNLAWYVVQSQFGSDKHALEWLARGGFETYYPQMRRLIPIPLRHLSQKQRRAMFKPTKYINVPLFPRYIFVRFDVRRSLWHELFATAGVAGMLCHGGVPAPVGDAEIARIHSGEIAGAVPAPTLARFLLAPGTSVRITEGPLAGFTGIVDRGVDVALGDLDADARIKVLASMFGTQTPVELEISQIEVR